MKKAKTIEHQTKNKKAAALKYDGENAPKLVAKGTGELANKIIDTAKQHDIHIHNDPLLLDVLSRLELGDEIPQQLYLAVAKIIAFAYFLQGKHPDYISDKPMAVSHRISNGKEVKP